MSNNSDNNNKLQQGKSIPSYQKFDFEDLETSDHSGRWEETPAVNGIPVITVPQKNYAPINAFDIHLSDDVIVSEQQRILDKLETWPYLCYKYWVLTTISLNILSIVSYLAVLVGSEDRVWAALSLCFISWQMAGLISVFEGMNKKSLKLVKRAIRLMRSYQFALWVYVFIFVIGDFAYKSGKCHDLSCILKLFCMAFFSACLALGFYVVSFRIGAEKIRIILQQSEDLLPFKQ